ncbi:Site-specific recombinase XerD [Salegentibacter echinorum]|uniref:Site-specific recombinase XerD n=1 Tax=Salegentibacter echinorum TaxID=1073325 RepID=A0A1M5DL60_SALEC|nr:site-specific integrase [Salegentibacter echinorum]SHF67713.1 Site-specific recombinase XerD [Salegentibacter echinorum]
MINTKIVIRKKRLSNGQFPIYFRITKDRKTKFFKTLFNAFEKEWDSSSGKFKKSNSNYLQYNRLLLNIEERALKLLAELEIEKEGFTLEDFEKRFRIERNPVQRNFFNFWDEIIEEMLAAGRAGNARANKDSYRSVLLFHKSRNLRFRDITPSFLDKYEVFLRARGGTDGGIGVRMRAIRAIYNRGIDRKIVKASFYPFRSYKLSRLKGKGQKRALSIEQIHKIVNMDISNHPHLLHSRNYFIFSFYTRGMNFADMLKLKWKNFKEDRIFYTRSKTKGNFIVKILPPVAQILDYYRKNNDGTKYIFPILLKDELLPQQIEYRKSKTLKQYNADLKEIARVCGIDKNITSYVARHSFANCLKQKGVATDVISESMGHQNLTVTQAYLKELDSSLLDEASELLL